MGLAKHRVDCPFTKRGVEEALESVYGVIANVNLKNMRLGGHFENGCLARTTYWYEHDKFEYEFTIATHNINEVPVRIVKVRRRRIDSR